MRLDAQERYDFTPLAAVAQSARVIMLGEQSHGDGATFRLKAEVVRYLHLNHGFNVLAFEGDFYALAAAWQNATRPAHVREQIAPHIYYFWRSPDTGVLWNLVETRFKSAAPLVIAGIDPRHTGQLGSGHLLGALHQALLHHKVVKIGEIDDLESFQGVLKDLLEHEYQHQADASTRTTFLQMLAKLRYRLEHMQGGDASFWSQELLNLSFFARNAWNFEGRDRGMAANLEWLTHKRYQGEKIIVWGHNFHIAKATTLIVRADGTYTGDPDSYPDTLLGEAASQKIDDVYSLGLISAEGWYHAEAHLGDLTRRTHIKTPPNESLEAHLANRGLNCAFIDLHAQPSEPFVMSGVKHLSKRDCQV